MFSAFSSSLLAVLSLVSLPGKNQEKVVLRLIPLQMYYLLVLFYR